MNEKEQLINLYQEIYAAMIAKDETELERIHADEFVLIHMTGMHQSKKEYIRAIMDGTLNYYSEETDSIDVSVSGDTAVMTGHSKVAAAVFGGGRHSWRLTLKFDAKKTDDGWKVTKAQASTW
jgi:conserved hypothetical protein